MKNLMSHAKLRVKLIIAGTILVIIPTIIIGISFSSRISSVILKQNESDMENQVFRLSQNLSNSLKLIEDLSDLIYLNESLQRDLLYDYENIGDSAAVYTNSIYPILRQNRILHASLINTISIYIENTRFLENGEEIIFADPNIKKNEWYKNLAVAKGNGKKLWRTTPVVSILGEKSNFTLYRQLNRYSNRLAGVLQITLRDDYFELQLQDNQTGRKNFILNSTGEIVLSNLSQDTQINAAYYADIFRSTLNQSGIIEFAENGQKFKVVYKKFSSSTSLKDNWTVVSIVPEALLLVQINEVRNIILLLCLGTLLVLVIFITLLSKSITQRINVLAQATKQVVEGNYSSLATVTGNDEISDLSKNFNNMLNHLNTLINEVVQDQIQIKNHKIKQQETEFISLQNQINPHFLYNTLDAIRMHAVLTDDVVVADMLVTLSNLLRYNMSRGNEYISIKEEINHVLNYLTLMNIRYEKAVVLETDISEELINKKILKLVLQPIVENSLKHGFAKNQDDSIIKISAFTAPNSNNNTKSLIIEISDNGQGMNQETLYKLNASFDSNDAVETSKSIGLTNVNSRIKLCFGAEYGLKASSIIGRMTKITMTIPFNDGGEIYA